MDDDELPIFIEDEDMSTEILSILEHNPEALEDDELVELYERVASHFERALEYGVNEFNDRAEYEFESAYQKALNFEYVSSLEKDLK